MGPKAQKKRENPPNPNCSTSLVLRLSEEYATPKTKPEQRRTAQLRLIKDRLKVQRVTLQKLEERHRTHKGALELRGFILYVSLT